MSERPVGLFDSGVGGLSVAREVCRLLPAEDIVYLADSAHCPYGVRPPEEILALSLQAARTLIEREAKLIVVACNTASTVAVARLRELLPLPVVGMVPAVKPAIEASRKGKVAVLATPATIATGTFSALVDQFGAGFAVEECPCPGLADLVEQAQVSGPIVEAALEACLGPALNRGADVIVLGSTHYAFLRTAIERLAGPEVRVIDSGAAVARQTARVLEDRHLRCETRRAGRLRVFTSGPLPVFRANLAALLQEPEFQPAEIGGWASTTAS